MVAFDFASFNWIAVVVAGVAAWIIGAVWFAPPIFGKRWMEALAMKPEQAGNPGPGFVAALVASIVGATFLRLVLGFAAASTFEDGLAIAMVVWFAFVFLPGVPGLFFTKRSGVAFGIEQAQHLVAMAAMGAILVSWT